MTTTRKRFSSEFKSKVALSALSGIKSLNELSKEFELHPNQISKWKSELQSRACEIFGSVKDKEAKKNSELIPELYRQIGQQKVELDWLKKKVKH